MLFPVMWRRVVWYTFDNLDDSYCLHFEYTWFRQRFPRNVGEHLLDYGVISKRIFIRTRTRIILGAFAKLWRATISCHMSLCTRTWKNSALTDFNESLNERSSKICRYNSNYIKIWQEYWVLYTNTYIYIYIFIYLAQFLEWKMFGQKIYIYAY
jgi:hypothetical protein